MSVKNQLAAFSLNKWIDENAHLLKPPVGNQQIWTNADLMVTVVGGPNQRTDFHDDPMEEFFYQLRGDMVLKVVEEGHHYDVPIQQGDVFCSAPRAAFAPEAPGRIRGPRRRAQAPGRRA